MSKTQPLTVTVAIIERPEQHPARRGNIVRIVMADYARKATRHVSICQHTGDYRDASGRVTYSLVGADFQYTYTDVNLAIKHARRIVGERTQVTA